MPLPVHERAALSLWLVAARCLDAECCSDETEREVAARNAARAELNGKASGAEAFVATIDELKAYLRANAQYLRKVPSAGPEIAQARALLKAEAKAAAGDGDGPALDHAGQPVATGILQLAGLIETRVRRALDEALPGAGAACSITYLTTLLPPDDGRFRVDGKASVEVSPRSVDLFLKRGQLGARDLLHLAYTLHHELICHAFQGALSDGAGEDAESDCDWSEGWMDTVTREQVLAWLPHAPADWLPLRGQEAVASIWAFHEARYELEVLAKSDLMRRRDARKACMELELLLQASGVATSAQDSRRRARDFSLVFNTHADAGTDRWKALAARLRLLLVGPRLGAKGAAAQATLRFAHHRSLLAFETDIAEAEGLN